MNYYSKGGLNAKQQNLFIVIRLNHYWSSVLVRRAGEWLFTSRLYLRHSTHSTPTLCLINFLPMWASAAANISSHQLRGRQLDKHRARGFTNSTRQTTQRIASAGMTPPPSRTPGGGRLRRTPPSLDVRHTLSLTSPGFQNSERHAISENSPLQDVGLADKTPCPEHHTHVCVVFRVFIRRSLFVHESDRRRCQCDARGAE